MKSQNSNSSPVILKVVLTGPESTGKSTLAQQLAAHYQTVCVPEYARTYIAALDRPYDSQDIVQIAKGQLDCEDFFLPKANKILFCDTALLVPKIWSEVTYGYCPEWIEHQLMQRHYDLYLLMYPDIDWQPDPQREHPHFRIGLFEMYDNLLKKLHTPYVVIRGTYRERLEAAMQAIEEMERIIKDT